MRNAPVQRSPPVVRVRHRRLQAALDCDVAVCGGTLGLFIALALQLRGHRVTVVEKRRVEGRTQEWNVSRAELDVLPVLAVIPVAVLVCALLIGLRPSWPCALKCKLSSCKSHIFHDCIRHQGMAETPAAESRLRVWSPDMHLMQLACPAMCMRMRGAQP